MYYLAKRGKFIISNDIESWGKREPDHNRSIFETTERKRQLGYILYMALENGRTFAFKVYNPSSRIDHGRLVRCRVVNVEIGEPHDKGHDDASSPPPVSQH